MNNTRTSMTPDESKEFTEVFYTLKLHQKRRKFSNLRR